MAESLLLPVVRGVAGKAGDALVESVTRMWGVDDIRGNLELQLLAVQSKLLDAELKSETEPAVKRWMKALRAVAYEADDVLDDFQYEALRREAQNQIGESTTRKVLSYFTRHSPLLFRFTVSRNMNNVLKKINGLVVDMNKFRLVDRAEAPQVLYRQTHSALDESSDIFGRDNDREVVVKLLLDQQDQKNLRVLPIIGMGGLGKTTLAKMVYNDHRVQNHFQLKMWHCVSDNFDACPVVRSVIELVTKERCNLPDTIELLRGRLQEAIGRRRYLLILDDVWNEEQPKWEDDLKPLLSSIGGPGSFIIVTCRSKQVASIMGTLGPHELACLSEDDSWELFSKKAFSSGGEEQAELVTIGRRIVKKCRGLPLALKTMGGLMSSKQQAQEWKDIEQSNIGGTDEILPILKLSYRHLSSEMKQCFAFCAIFPKDYEMDKYELIQLWMANGFIQEEGTVDLAQKGEYIFHNLVWRSFLQDVKAKTYYSPYTTYESTGCKMHDLMHDLAKDVTDECATIEELIQQKDVRHMRVSFAELEQNIGVLKGRSSLRTLLEKVRSHKDLKGLRLVSIRVLRCYSPSIINSQVVNAKHLRYLDLSGSPIVRLPNSICMLYNLQSLRLNDCGNLKYLPEDMRTMRKLIHLYLFGCSSLERMPPNISLLNNLRTLTAFIVDTEDGRGVEELKDLRHLANMLELYNLRKIKSAQKAKEANLHQKQNLIDLRLYWGRTRDDMAEDEACDEEAVLESLAPHSKLQRLEVHGYGGLEISQWMRDPQMFRCVRTLIISNCPRCKDLPVAWLSVSLEYLSLQNMGSLTTLCKSIEAEAEGYNIVFPKLKEMFLNGLPNLERWAENSAGEPSCGLLVFPQLEKLEMISCPKLALLLGSWPSLVKLQVRSPTNMMMMPPQNQSQRALENLRELSLDCPNCFVVLSESLLWESFAFVQDLDISGCVELVRWPVEELRCLVRLRSLSISDCANLEGKGSSSEQTLSLPQLERLHIHKCGSLLEIPMLPASLEMLLIQECGSLLEIPMLTASLERLGIWGCGSLLEIPMLPASLKMLDIQECGSLLEIPMLPASLEILGIQVCDSLLEIPILPASLEMLLIRGFGSLLEIPMLPASLEGLDILGCDSLLEIPILPASLESLHIRSCRSLVALPSNLGNLGKLRELHVCSCRGLKALPDGLASLERLDVSCCPGIEKFPQGLLQRIPALTYLQIDGCPDLQRRCRQGGKYFHLVSSIPERLIEESECIYSPFFFDVLLRFCDFKLGLNV